MSAALVLDLAEVSKADVGVVGGKNASLGEMIGALVPGGVAVPAGFATTASAFRLFLDHNGLVAVIADLFAAGADPGRESALSGQGLVVGQDSLVAQPLHQDLLPGGQRVLARRGQLTRPIGDQDLNTS